MILLTLYISDLYKNLENIYKQAYSLFLKISDCV